MPSARKSIFAGKQQLQAKPFFPCISNETGFASLRSSRKPAPPGSGSIALPRPSYRDGKRNI